MPLVETHANKEASLLNEPSLFTWPGYTRAQTEYLDTVRGVAAQLVLLQHCADTYHTFSLPGQFGNLGVTLFFLLSGFLIIDSIRTRKLAGNFSLAEFMVSRFTRIFMPYLPAIVFVAVVDSYSANSPLYRFGANYNWYTAVANVFMLQDFSAFQLLRRLHVPDQVWFVSTFGSAKQFWTISIEWWIYVTVGIGTAILSSNRSRNLLALVLCISAFETLYNFIGGPGNSLTGYWMLGAAASVAYRHAHAARPSAQLLILTWAGLLGLAVMRLLYNHFQVYDMVFVMILCPLLFIPVYAYRLNPGPSIFHYCRVNKLAFHSYSLYLTHASVVVLILLLARDHLAMWPAFLASIIVSNLIAIPFAFVFEQPQKKARRSILRWLGSHGILEAQREFTPFTVDSIRIQNR